MALELVGTTPDRITVETFHPFSLYVVLGHADARGADQLGRRMKNARAGSSEVVLNLIGIEHFNLVYEFSPIRGLRSDRIFVDKPFDAEFYVGRSKIAAVVKLQAFTYIESD